MAVGQGTGTKENGRWTLEYSVGEGADSGACAQSLATRSDGPMCKGGTTRNG